MKTRTAIIAVMVFLFSALTPYQAMAEKAVAWIVGGCDGCKVTRFENGEFKEYPAKQDMPLFPGDRIDKKDNIKNVRFEYLPYFEPKIKDGSTAIILNNAPVNKDSIFTRLANFLGLVKSRPREIKGTSRGAWGHDAVPLENATLLSGCKITFDDYYKRKTLVFKELDGKEVFSKTFAGNDLELVPGKIGLQQEKMYIREIKIGATIDFRSTIRVLGKEDEAIVNNALTKIDAKKITTEEKILEKAAYLQFISDCYPDQVDLYWFSFQLLDKAEIKEERLLDLNEILLARCFDHKTGGITAADFALLDNRPGCLVTVHLKRENESTFVAPDFPFKSYDEFYFYFQGNIGGYCMVLHENFDALDLAFPGNEPGYHVTHSQGNRSCSYRFDDKPGIENYIFIFSDKPLEEMEQYTKLSGNKWNCGKLSAEQRKLLDALLKRVKEKGQKLDLEIMGSKGFARAPGKTLSGLVWFQVALEN